VAELAVILPRFAGNRQPGCSAVVVLTLECPAWRWRTAPLSPAEFV